MTKSLAPVPMFALSSVWSDAYQQTVENTLSDEPEVLYVDDLVDLVGGDLQELPTGAVIPPPPPTPRVPSGWHDEEAITERGCSLAASVHFALAAPDES